MFTCILLSKVNATGIFLENAARHIAPIEESRNFVKEIVYFYVHFFYIYNKKDRVGETILVHWVEICHGVTTLLGIRKSLLQNKIFLDK